MDHEDKKQDNQGFGNKGERQGQQNIPNQGQKPDTNRNVDTGLPKQGDPNKGMNRPSNLENEESDEKM